jgi:hypothetical protein
MSFEREFLEFMPHVVTIFPRTAQLDRYGAHTYAATGVAYRCRVGGKIVSLRKQASEEVGSILDVWLGARVDELPITTTAISVLDKIELPADGVWFDRYPIIFAVGQYPDPDGMHNIKVQCGWMYHRQGQ